MTTLSTLLSDLQTKRDELKLKVHLGSKELQDEWNELEEKFDKFKSKAELDKSADSIGDAADELAGEISKAYEKLKQAL